MLLRLSLKGIIYLPATLLFAMLVPLLYTLTELPEHSKTGVLYLECLLIIIPIIVTEQAAKRVKSFILYWMIGALLLAGIVGITGLIYYFDIHSDIYYTIYYCVGMSAETVFITVKRFMDRVKEARLKREEPFAAKEISFLEHPTPVLIWYFVVIYLLGLCLKAKILCDIAFFNAIVYTFLALVYEYFDTTKKYLEMNKRTQGISRRRLYGIGFSMFLAFAVLLFVCMLPAVFMAVQIQYPDIRSWFGDVKFAPYEYEMDIGFMPEAPVGADMMALLSEGQPAQEPSKLANVILWVIGTVCILVFLYGVFMAIKQVLMDFRSNCDENGDIVEEIQDDDTTMQKEDILNRKGHHSFESEAERIRRRYRKMIQKHRKERPAPYESPAEIEEYAGLKEDGQMQQLHKEYEEVRYGKINCKICNYSACN